MLLEQSCGEEAIDNLLNLQKDTEDKREVLWDTDVLSVVGTLTLKSTRL